MLRQRVHERPCPHRAHDREIGQLLPIFGSRPVGQANPEIVTGLKLEGVALFTFLKSKVSMWLRAPPSRMKTTFLALFCVTTPG